MSVTLCFDFGNTRRKCAVFKNAGLEKIIVLKDDSDQTIQALINDFNPRKSILSSVIDHNPVMEELLTKQTKFHRLSHLTKLAFTTPVGKPETIGADRLALTAAAVHFYPRRNNLVIGLGTCITYNFINKYHELVGGSISPGMEMRLKAMNHFTAKLPLVEADSNVPLIGYDTKSNMLSGAVLGMAYEIDGFIDEYAKKFDNFNVLLTGGDIVHLASHLKNKIFADPDLIFKGLYAISEVNNL
ncbi:type III pantothenate kinase [Terrimonas pollutisoli]|uniref:type III pantothenate kinase n=1 Tax=Terrimonas pollutisoli TaxID=3034147 RepID=UPI0023EA7AE3|nr:type III pantothenate kinase [Terrimonas sp. H1YJ31]